MLRHEINQLNQKFRGPNVSTISHGYDWAGGSRTGHDAAPAARQVFEIKTSKIYLCEEAVTGKLKLGLRLCVPAAGLFSAPSQEVNTHP
jgi:hypothetical protein